MNKTKLGAFHWKMQSKKYSQLNLGETGKPSEIAHGKHPSDSGF